MSVYLTKGISNDIESDTSFAKEVTSILRCYLNRDWGDLCHQDVKMNEDALSNGGRLFASYKTSKGKVYIITDDTSANDWITTVLFASEY